MKNRVQSEFDLNALSRAATSRPALPSNLIAVPLRRRRSQSGSVLMVLMFSLLGISLIGYTLARVADTSNHVSHKSDMKVESTSLAEAAVQQQWAQICTTMNTATANVTSFTLNTTTVNSSLNSTSQTIGTYYATATQPSPPQSLGGNSYKLTYQIDGYGTTAGTATTAATSHVRAIFSGTWSQSSGSNPPNTNNPLGSGALQVNGLLTVKTDGQVSTQDSGGGGKTANFVANGGVSWLPYNNARNANANGNSIVLQGQIMVPSSTVSSSAWNYTNSTSTGIFKTYNSNTVKIFQTPSDSANGIAQNNTLQSMSALASFPSAAQVATWDAAWKSQAQAGKVYSSTVSFNNGDGSGVARDTTGEYRITAPAIINGDLNVNSGQLYLMPNSDTTKSNVVYVTGNVTNAALLYNRGVKLVIVGSYTDTSSGHYQLQTQYSPYSMTQLYAITALISEKASPSAITLGSNATSEMGLIYAANGGMVINSSMWIYGAVVAGGTGTNSGVTITTQGGGFGINYQANAVTGRSSDFAIASAASSTSFNTGKTPLASWQQIQ